MGPTFGTEFAELTVANEGLVDVEILLFAFEVGALRKGSPGVATSEIHLEPKAPGHGPPVVEMSLPHHLRPADSFSVFFDRDQLVEQCAELGGGSPVRLRPFCHDSLGKKHTMDRWIAYGADNHSSIGFSPSEDRISQENLAKMSAEERRLYDDGWRTTYIPPRSG